MRVPESQPFIHRFYRWGSTCYSLVLQALGRPALCRYTNLVLEECPSLRPFPRLQPMVSSGFCRYHALSSLTPFVNSGAVVTADSVQGAGSPLYPPPLSLLALRRRIPPLSILDSFARHCPAGLWSQSPESEHPPAQFAGAMLAIHVCARLKWSGMARFRPVL